jgi:protein tyrosine/serine phosphatase
MFHESLPDYVEIYETKKKEYLKEVDNWNTDKVEERKERLFIDEKINLYKYCSFWIWNKLLSFSYGQSISGDNPIND